MKTQDATQPLLPTGIPITTTCFHGNSQILWGEDLSPYAAEPAGSGHGAGLLTGSYSRGHRVWPARLLLPTCPERGCRALSRSLVCGVLSPLCLDPTAHVPLLPLPSCKATPLRGELPPVLLPRRARLLASWHKWLKYALRGDRQRGDHLSCPPLAVHPHALPY